MQKFDENSARWAVDFVEKLLHLRWQEAVKDLHAARNPIEHEFFSSIAEIDQKASKLYQENPDKAHAFLTKLTQDRMERIVNMFRRLRLELLTRYSGDSF
jgi:dipeptidase